MCIRDSINAEYGRAVRNSLTYSFGSVCFGSLILALIRVAQYYLKKSKKTKNPFLKICLLAILCCVKRIIRAFNTYAFVYVAMYNKSYLMSAKETLIMVKKHGLSAAISDSVVEDVMDTGTFVGGLTCGGVAGILGIVYKLPIGYIALVMVLGFFIGQAILMIPMSVLDSSVATLFICFSSFPEVMEHTKPDLYKPVIEKWKQISDQLAVLRKLKEEIKAKAKKVINKIKRKEDKQEEITVVETKT
eukprot:TRINITY_DN7678_c0_g1_i1.p1 TRINITY_DN7678_c0_g1~~TRINITY_DN7678_c0_g1_i1.p1  ORF type:complete len:246 (-),score=49.75 TRINITY_DN7678_c0_g1_i1:54-791(-)